MRRSLANAPTAVKLAAFFSALAVLVFLLVELQAMVRSNAGCFETVMMVVEGLLALLVFGLAIPAGAVAVRDEWRWRTTPRWVFYGAAAAVLLSGPAAVFWLRLPRYWLWLAPVAGAAALLVLIGVFSNEEVQQLLES